VKINSSLERYRFRAGPLESPALADYGAFERPGPCGADLKIIASPGDANENIPWEHVSVSCRNRCPNWTEMSYVKDLFWDEEETVIQLHPPRSQWINNHPYVLHLWKPIGLEIPLPPSIAVGYKELNLKGETL
jgi:hypothetical protein